MMPPTGLPLGSSTVASAGIGRPALDGGHCVRSTSSSTLAQATRALADYPRGRRLATQFRDAREVEGE